jgi:nitrite reductase/ring-hydroxylating ferredoxin subunit
MMRQDRPMPNETPFATAATQPVPGPAAATSAAATHAADGIPAGDGPCITRRAFLAGSVALAGLSAVSLAACGTPYGPYPSPNRWIAVSTAGLEVGVPSFVEFELTPAAPSVPEASPPLGSMPPGRGGTWLVKQADGSVVAFVPFCTHQACVVDWKPDQSHFVCPCHPGIFTIDGEVVSGPPPGPMWRFETRQTGADTIEIGWV